MNNLLISLWWVIPIIVALVAYKFVLRVFFGMVIVPDDAIGMVIKKYALTGEKRLPDGCIVAINGEAGMQAKALAPFLAKRGGADAACSPEGLSMLLASISRNVIMESAVGISLGHTDAKAVVELALARLGAGEDAGGS